MKSQTLQNTRDSILGVLSLGLAGLSLITFAGCAHHPREQVTVVQAPAPAAAQPQTVIVDHDRDRDREPRTIVVQEGPPAPREETMATDRPSSEHAWVPGHYEYRNSSYTWVSGRWEVPPHPGAVYVAPRWEQRGDSHVYVEGYWR